MRILWAPLAIERVTDIAQYISQDNPAAAENWVETIFTKVKHLESFPESGRIVPETDNQTIRELVYSNYRIIYRIEKNQLSILTVRHGKQTLPEDDILP